MNTVAGPMRRPSLRAFARSQGMSLAAIQRAVRAGRLTSASVGRDAKGRAVLVDAGRAAQELAMHTRPWVGGGKANETAPGKGPALPPSALAAATLRERRARAMVMEVQIARLVRDLVPAREVELRWAAQIVAARTMLLGIPSRLKGRCPHLSPADLEALDQLLREGLGELAAGTGTTP